MINNTWKKICEKYDFDASSPTQAKNKGILVVYNTCTVDVIAHGGWMHDINTVLNQDFENYRLAVSEFRGERAPDIRGFDKYILSKGGYYNITYDSLSSFVTFNHTVREIVKRLGTFEYYMLMGSGLFFTANDTLRNIYGWLSENRDVARASLPQGGNDNGYPPVEKTGPGVWPLSVTDRSGFGCPDSMTHANQLIPPSLHSEPYYIPPGYCINDHCSIYSNDWFYGYDEKLRPDIFIGHGNEGTYSYMAAAIGKRCAIPPLSIYPPLGHNPTQDGSHHGAFCRGRLPYRWHLFKDPEEEARFTEMLNRNGIFMDSYAPVPGAKNFDISRWTGRANMYSSAQQREILIERFGHDSMSMDPQDRKNLHELCKKEFFVTKIYEGHGTHGPKEFYFDYDFIKSELFGF